MKKVSAWALSILASFFSILAASQIAVAGQPQTDCLEILRQYGVPPKSFLTPTENTSPLHKEVIRIALAAQNGVSSFESSREKTVAYARFDTTFQVKNPATGQYDVTVKVPVAPNLAPVPLSQFEKFVEASGPLLRAYRDLLQRVFRLKSPDQINVESLGLRDLPRPDAELMVKVIKDSMYLEPKLMGRAMDHYPFVAVAGLDGVIGDPANMNPSLFEVNLGTPSGMSNNTQIEDLFRRDGMWFDLERLGVVPEPPDQTFTILREAIESNALAWTGNPQGLSVVVSPGPYNAAHPDVVAIARYSGMPLVEVRDLYFDERGYVRWNLGSRRVHPIISGIYGRRDESFFLQSDREQIPMINPAYKDNEKLGAKLGVKLRSGAIYQFIRDEHGEIIDVARDASGAPLLQSVWEEPGRTEAGTMGKESSFAEAIRTRRLYYSGLGGRVVDDKRILPLVHKYLLKPKDQVRSLRPAPTLERADYSRLYEEPRKFVVKDPDNSGGVGIRVLAQKSDDEIKEILEQVRARPESFEVQYLAEVTMMSVVDQATHGLVEVPTDIRFFVVLDAQGRARAGRNSILIRTASPGSLLSNTSQGGGYAYGFVFNDKRRVTKPRMPTEAVHGDFESARVRPFSHAPDRRQVELDKTLASLGGVLADLMDLTPGAANGEELRLASKNLVYQLRAVMDLLPRSAHPIISALREFSEQGQDTLGRVQLEISHWYSDFVGKLDHKDAFPHGDAFSSLLRYRDQYQWKVTQLARLRSALHGIEVLPLVAEETVYTYEAGGFKYRRNEVGRYRGGHHWFVDQVATELEALGGELRLANLTSERGGLISNHSETPYFWVNYSLPGLTSYLRPIIALDLGDPGALPALAHEFAHFKFWREKFETLVAQGIGRQEAMRQAAEDIMGDGEWMKSEHEAVRAEMAIEKKIILTHPDALFRKTNSDRRALVPMDQGYINRITYPEFRILTQILLRRVAKESKWDDFNLAKRLMNTLVDAALKGKQDAELEFGRTERMLEVRGGAGSRQNLDPEAVTWSKISRDFSQLREMAPETRKGAIHEGRKQMKEALVVRLLTEPYGAADLKASGIWDDFNQLLSDELRQRGLDARGLALDRVMVQRQAASE